MRLDIAYTLLGLLVLGGASIIWLTRRYRRYYARKLRGHYDKPVWKPFWID